MTTTTLRRWATAVTVSTNQDAAAQLRICPRAACVRLALITASGLEGREIVTSQIASL